MVFPLSAQRDGALVFLHAAAAAAKSLQSCPTLCDPIDGSPLGSPVPGILQARTLEWVAISFSNAWKWKVKVKSLSRVRLLAIPWTAAYQAPPSMGFSRQEYWNRVPLPSPVFLLRAQILSDHSPTLQLHLIWVTSIKAHISKYSQIRGLRLQQINLGAAQAMKVLVLEFRTRCVALRLNGSKVIFRGSFGTSKIMS